MRRDEESFQVFGRNLLSDHRVSELRAAHFLEVTGNPGAGDIGKAITRYHDDWICERRGETYLCHDANGHNFVSRSRLPKDLSLVTVLNLSAWVWELRTVPGLGLSIEEGFRQFTSPSASAGEKETYLSRLFAAINSHWDGRPMWVARWKDFEKSVDTSIPSTWNADVGVRRAPGAWQVALRYPAADVKCLVRPTVLDCAPNSLYHFPSPPLPRPTRGGFTMALRQAPERAPLISEWIHPPIKLKIEHCIAGLCAEVGDSGIEEVWAYRNWHRRKLAARFKKEVDGWLPEK